MDGGCATGGAAGAAIAAALKFFAASQCLLTETWPPQANVPDGSTFDFIVVGGGTAGSTVAARLSELPYKVLLLEAGDDPPQDSNIPIFKDSLKEASLDWNFTTQNDFYSSQALQDGVQFQPRGKMLGGCGSMNDMIYSRGFPADYEEWASIVGDEWKWSNVLEYFKKTEQLTDKRILKHSELAQLHGFNGEIEVSGSEEAPPASIKFLEAFKDIGFKMVNDMTNPSNIGVGRFSHTIRNGKRDSSLTALLNKAGSRSNLYVLKNALVTKILIQNNTAFGVRVLMDNTELQFFSNKEIVVTAGTFNTPKLLLLSGIGPREQLRDLEIPIVKELPVGENLHDHSMVLTYFAAESGTCTVDEKTFYMDTIRYLYDGSGMLSRSSDMGAYISFNKLNKNVPDFAIYPVCMAVNTNFYDSCRKFLNLSPDICSKIQEVNKNYEVFTLAVVNLKPNSRGRVQLNSADPLDPPLIYSGTFSDPSDLAHYPEAIRKALSIIKTPYFRSKNAFILDFSLTDCKSLLNENERLKCIARNMAMMAWHSVGTASMGTVVDSKLRVKGISGLRVADASVMPKVVRGNTNSPIVMIAEKASDYIKQSIADFYPDQTPEANEKPLSFQNRYPILSAVNTRPNNYNNLNFYPNGNMNTNPTMNPNNYNNANQNHYPHQDTIISNNQNVYPSGLNNVKPNIVPNNYNKPNQNVYTNNYNQNSYPNNYNTPNQHVLPNRYPSTGTNPNGLKGWAAVATTAIETVGSMVDTIIKVKVPSLGGYITGNYGNNPKDLGNLTETELFSNGTSDKTIT